MLKDQRTRPVLLTRVKNGLIISRLIDRALERRIEVSIQIRGCLYAGSQFQALEIFEFGADGFIKDQTVCENVTNRPRGTIDKLAPALRCANNEPSLLACHPFL